MTKPMTFEEKIDNDAHRAASSIAGHLANAQAKQEGPFGVNTIIASQLAKAAAGDINLAGIEVSPLVSRFVAERTGIELRIRENRAPV